MNRSSNQDNEFLNFLEQGKDVGKAIKEKNVVDTQKALRAKYPSVPVPTHRRIRSLSNKQRRAISHQKGEI